jgi:hypothetical protein
VEIPMSGYDLKLPTVDSEGSILWGYPEKPTECLPELSAVHPLASALWLLRGVLQSNSHILLSCVREIMVHV